MGFYTVVIWYVQVPACNPFIVIIVEYSIHKTLQTLDRSLDITLHVIETSTH